MAAHVVIHLAPIRGPFYVCLVENVEDYSLQTPWVKVLPQLRMLTLPYCEELIRQ